MRDPVVFRLAALIIAERALRPAGNEICEAHRVVYRELHGHPSTFNQLDAARSLAVRMVETGPRPTTDEPEEMSSKEFNLRVTAFLEKVDRMPTPEERSLLEQATQGLAARWAEWMAAGADPAEWQAFLVPGRPEDDGFATRLAALEKVGARIASLRGELRDITTPATDEEPEVVVKEEPPASPLLQALARLRAAREELNASTRVTPEMKAELKRWHTEAGLNASRVDLRVITDERGALHFAACTRQNALTLNGRAPTKPDRAALRAGWVRLFVEAIAPMQTSPTVADAVSHARNSLSLGLNAGDFDAFSYRDDFGHRSNVLASMIDLAADQIAESRREVAESNACRGTVVATDRNDT